MTVAISPTAQESIRLDNTMLYITTPSLQNDTLYTITLSFGSTTQSFQVTTAPANSSAYNDTLGQQSDIWTKDNRPDVTVYNYLPYSSSTFSIQAVSSPGHYTFIVTQSSATGKQDLLDWLKNTIGLTDTQIGKLDIQYQ